MTSSNDNDSKIINSSKDTNKSSSSSSSNDSASPSHIPRPEHGRRQPADVVPPPLRQRRDGGDGGDLPAVHVPDVHRGLFVAAAADDHLARAELDGAGAVGADGEV